MFSINYCSLNCEMGTLIVNSIEGAKNIAGRLERAGCDVRVFEEAKGTKATAIDEIFGTVHKFEDLAGI